jgi:copper chaperone
MTTQITVENIKCGGCMSSIKTTLLKIANVEDISIAKDTATILISGRWPFEREDIVSQLAKMGYPEKGNNNLLLKAKSYVSCAIGNLSEKV